MNYFIISRIIILKILTEKSSLLLGLVLCCSTITAKEFLPPNLAFKPIIDGSVITINIADGYYLYQQKITVFSQNKPIQMNFINKPIVKTFAQYGTFAVYLDKAQLRIPANAKPPITIRYQGCSSMGLCYPPQQATLKTK